ncbi:MAG: hypothetical protein NC206_08825 [Bacteroides sp.]|nr:hypothetical protein [Roseburia sp.]MCM1347174.1 hypothetical protein [Bacteroides sp.]MCM1421678.1 hypothetical protein [Bacteroides sp.]
MLFSTDILSIHGEAFQEEKSESDDANLRTSGSRYTCRAYRMDFLGMYIRDESLRDGIAAVRWQV